MLATLCCKMSKQTEQEKDEYQIASSDVHKNTISERLIKEDMRKSTWQFSITLCSRAKCFHVISLRSVKTEIRTL